MVEIDYIPPDKNFVVVIQPLAPKGSLKDLIYKVCGGVACVGVTCVGGCACVGVHVGVWWCVGNLKVYVYSSCLHDV